MSQLFPADKTSVVVLVLFATLHFIVVTVHCSSGGGGSSNSGSEEVIRLSPGAQGVGEVISVSGDEYTQLVRKLNNSDSSSSSEAPPPPKIIADPQDSSRIVQQQPDIDRRKVESSGGGGGNSDLSFTGILNGLLDSFINDSPPQQQQSNRSPSSTPPQSFSSSSPEELEEDDELEEEELRVQPSSSSPSPSEDVSLEDTEQAQTSEEPLDDELDLSELDDVDPPSPPSSSNSTKKLCTGECRNIIFGLFLCDEIDNEAHCSEPGLACCVNNDDNNNDPYSLYGNDTLSDNEHASQELPNTNDNDDDEEEDEEPQVSDENKPQSPQPPPPPQQQSHTSSSQQRYPPPPKYSTRLPPPNYHAPPPHYYYNNQNAPPQSSMMHHPPPHHHHHPHLPPPRIPLPCPRYCVKNFLEPYCSERLPSQFACGVDGFCCGHDVPVNSAKDEDNENGNNNNNGFRNEDVENEQDEGVNDDDGENGGGSGNKVLGPCTEEIGSCVSRNIISIICFAHATPTDMYTCPRSSMKCCARKTALPKDPQSTTQPPPPQLLKPDNSITRNSTSGKLPPPPPQILPQFAPQQHQQQQQPSLTPQQGPALPHGYPQFPPSPPPLAETPPPPPPHSIPLTQYTSPFTSNALGSTRVPPRQPVGGYVCGVKGVPTVSKKRRKKRVVGGSDSLPGEWCWQVALINSLNQYLCGGALIGTQWVLTAAHCVSSIVRSGDAIYVRVGDHDLTSRYGSPGAQTLRVATTYIHHNHNSQTLDNDIALLKLQGNAALKEGVCLVCLPSRNHMSEIPGKRCTVTGYGYMGESGPIPLRIREANLPIVSEDECVRKVNAVTEKVFALPMSSFCAGGELRNDACQGDGGGPLVCRADDPTTGDPGTGYYELTGLVSWGFGCGRENVPGVYVKVSSFIGWIHQIIRSN